MWGWYVWARKVLAYQGVCIWRQLSGQIASTGEPPLMESVPSGTRQVASQQTLIIGSVPCFFYTWDPKKHMFRPWCFGHWQAGHAGDHCPVPPPFPEMTNPDWTVAWSPQLLVQEPKASLQSHIQACRYPANSCNGRCWAHSDVSDGGVVLLFSV